MAFVTVFRVTVTEENSRLLLEIRSEAIAEAQKFCPELLSAELIRLRVEESDGGEVTEGEEWLDILTWSVPDGEQRLMKYEAEFTSLAKMHSLVEVVVPPSRGEIVHSVRP